VGTVSNVVSGTRNVRPETRARVERAIAELGFRPDGVARALIRRRTQTVGMVVPDVTNPFFSELVWEVERALTEADYAVVFGNSANDPARERRYLEAFLGRRVDALVVAVTAGADVGLVRGLAAEVPTVFVDRLVPSDVDSVVGDNDAGTALVVDHLVGLGHRSIALVNGEEGLETARVREAGAPGYTADLIVRAGGRVMFSEVTEVRDAAHILAPRMANQEILDKFVNELKWYDHYLSLGGADRSANTTPGNQKGGLSNIVEKALGSVVKSGSSPIVDVIAPGEKVMKRGLSFSATPASDFICGTLQLAAGMNAHVFVTGRGSPYGLAMVPVVKVSTNSVLSKRWYDLIDIDAGSVALGEKTVEQMGWELFHFLLEVASGKKQVACDKLKLHNDLVLFNPGPVT
jgi:hypothetical protein